VKPAAVETRTCHGFDLFINPAEDILDEEVILGGLSILFAGMVVLVPVLGITLRLAIKPFFDTWAEIQRGRSDSERNALLERQIDLLETELQQVQQVLGSLVEAQEFQRKLADPTPDTAGLVGRTGMESITRA
jgi:hypothetical protein